MITNVRWSSGIVYYCQTLMKLEFSREILEKISNTKFHENLSVGGGLFHVDRQADRQT